MNKKQISSLTLTEPHVGTFTTLIEIGQKRRLLAFNCVKVVSGMVKLFKNEMFN
jgi:hypothetical protein